MTVGSGRGYVRDTTSESQDRDSSFMSILLFVTFFVFHLLSH